MRIFLALSVALSNILLALALTFMATQILLVRYEIAKAHAVPNDTLYIGWKQP